MRQIFVLSCLFLFVSCSKQDCFECIDENAELEISDQIKKDYDLTIPNFAIGDRGEIPLLDINRFDNSSFTLINPMLTMIGEDSKIIFDGDASSLIGAFNIVAPPTSLFYTNNVLQEGQINFNLSFTESISNQLVKVKGKFLLVSCETYLKGEINNLVECRDNLSNFDPTYGC